MKKQIQPVDLYLIHAQRQKIKPNFYLSKSYLQVCKAKCWATEEWVWLEADGWFLFPPLPLKENPSFLPKMKNIWSDFNGTCFEPLHPVFLDYEYLLDCKQFNDMSGHTWEVFRKNSRKWPRDRKNWKYTDLFKESDLRSLLTEWLTTKMDTAQDPEIIVEYVLDFSLPQVERRYLYDQDQLMAINIWDENYQYINYRYCIIKPGERFLDEFVRKLFYTDECIQNKNKLINDGGVLDSKGLENFKDKLNPIQKRKVNSWMIDKN